MKISQPAFRAKILLFGEYTLMSGSMALTFPLSRFSGKLEKTILDNTDKIKSNKSLHDFFAYLESSRQDFPPGLSLDLEEFKKDINDGLYLSSDIPQGYGAGSSGVLVASVYNAYSNEPPERLDENGLSKLKSLFSFMESYFHGKSSGLDPLACYVQKPLLVFSERGNSKVRLLDTVPGNPVSIFLLDTGSASKTGGLVNLYHQRAKHNEFSEVLEKRIIPVNNKCIDSFLGGESHDFFENIRQLSELQLEYFRDMIPGDFRDVWKYGTDTGQFSLKLCGSGGGGFILGFTAGFQKTEEYFKSLAVSVLPFP